MARDQDAVALRCGHVCCSPCMETWLKSSHKRCPVCQYLPLSGEMPSPVSLRFAGGATLRTRSLIDLDDAIKKGTDMKDLVSGLADAGKLTAHEVQTLLTNALKLHATMQDLCPVRELQGVMSDIPSHLVAIKDDISSYHHKLGITQRHLKERQSIREELQRKLKRQEVQIQGLKLTLGNQKNEYENKLGGSQAMAGSLHEEKQKLRASFITENNSLGAEIERSEQLVTELAVAVENIKVPMPGRMSKIVKETSRHAMTIEDPLVAIAEEVISRPPLEAPVGAKAEATRQPGPLPWVVPMEEAEKQLLLSRVLGSSGSSVTDTPTIAGPWSDLLNRTEVTQQCATAFFKYYSGLNSTPTINMREKCKAFRRYKVSVMLYGRKISGIGTTSWHARKICEMEFWAVVRATDFARWEQFIQLPMARRFWI